MRLLTTLSFLCILASSCSTTKQIPYFSTPTFDSSHLFVFENYEVPIQIGDQLSIVISALNPASAAIYNFPQGTKGVTVDRDGHINMPQLGKIRVTGLTLPQLKELLQSRLKTFVTDPVVMIDFVNFKITVLGEVASQGPINVPDGRINIIEAIAQAGDITAYGKKHQVQIIRESNGRREFGWVNLYSPSVFTTPYYRLRQNDIIYVHPDENKPVQKENKFRESFSLITSLIGIVTTVVFAIIQFTK